MTYFSVYNDIKESSISLKTMIASQKSKCLITYGDMSRCVSTSRPSQQDLALLDEINKALREYPNPYMSKEDHEAILLRVFSCKASEPIDVAEVFSSALNLHETCWTRAVRETLEDINSFEFSPVVNKTLIKA